MKKKWCYLLLPLSGVLTGLCVSYILPAAAEWFALVPFLAVVFWLSKGEVSPRRGFFVGFAYFYPYYLMVWHWFLLMYPLDFTGLTRPAALAAVVAAWLGLPLIQALLSMLQVPLFLAVSKSRIVRGKFAKTLLYPIVFGGIYVVFEWLQTFTWAGVPWGRLAIGQAYTPIFVRSASLFGSYFVSFVIVAVNGYAALAALWTVKRENAKAIASLGLACTMFALNLTLGGIVYATHTACGEEKAVTIAALQGNISSADKWSDNGYANVSDVYERLTDAAAADGAEIVVWPETTLPYVINKISYMVSFVEGLADENEVTIFATSFWDDDGDTYNAVLNVSPTSGIDTECVYRKQRLVPFGEFVPFEAFVKKVFPPLAGLDMFSSTVSTGDGAYVAETDYGKVGNLVCFDSIYEEYSLAAVRDGAELLTISTNDSWFGQSAALYQHTAQAILRAVETDRYIVRAANTGYTCVLSPTGEIVDEIEIDEENYVVSEVYMRSTRTLYSITGNLFVWVFAAIVLILLADSIFAAVKREKNKRLSYTFRLAEKTDLDEIFAVYADGRKAIAELGIDQWQDSYPSRAVIEADVEARSLYVVEEAERIAAAAAYLPPPEPDYAEIDGGWKKNTDNYAVIHRVAASGAYRGRGASSALVERLLKFAEADGRDSVRADTHRGNIVMQSFLSRHGFEKCGTVQLSHGEGDRVRIAYEFVIRK